MVMMLVLMVVDIMRFVKNIKIIVFRFIIRFIVEWGADLKRNTMALSLKSEVIRPALSSTWQ